MAGETVVNLKLDSGSLFEVLQEQFGGWRLADHRFEPDADELRLYADTGGAGRISLTIGFELDRAQMEHLLRSARPAG
jgi:hypothetical protein